MRASVGLSQAAARQREAARTEALRQAERQSEAEWRRNEAAGMEAGRREEMERQQLERALQLSRETSEVRPTPSPPAARFEPPIE